MKDRRQRADHGVGGNVEQAGAEGILPNADIVDVGGLIEHPEDRGVVDAAAAVDGRGQQAVKF